MDPKQYLKAFFDWIIQYVLDTRKQQWLQHVSLVMLEDHEQNAFVDGAGGGAYVPSTYKPNLVTIMNRVLDGGRSITAGRSILVRARQTISQDALSRMHAALILWHETGHALGHPDRAKWGEKPEERGWLFEIEAVSHAFASGALAGWGINADVVYAVMQKRRPTYSKDFTDPNIQQQVIRNYDTLIKQLGH